MENKQTAIEWFSEKLIENKIINLENINLYSEQYKISNFLFEQAKQKEINQMIDFALWLRNNDTQENAEMFANFSDIDMLNYYLNLKK